MGIVVSGTRPTGVLHLGNYYGAVRNYVRMQEQADDTCFFFIADYHSLTTHRQPELLKGMVMETVATYLSAGLDPEKVHIYVQSDLPETAELFLLFNMIAYKGELEKVPTFKEKIKKHKENINAGLLTYPVLMAADILIHRADRVPVGKDQEQHLEMTRNFAKRFNHHFSVELFPEPVAYNFGEELIKVPSLDGSGKMSKSASANSAIFLNDSEETILKKLKKAKTDSGPTEPNQEKPEEIQNLFDLMSIVSEPSTIQHFEDTYNKCEVRYGDLKKQLGEDMARYIKPFRERAERYLADTAGLEKLLRHGAEAAHESARETVRQAREAVGIRYY